MTISDNKLRKLTCDNDVEYNFPRGADARVFGRNVLYVLSFLHEGLYSPNLNMKATWNVHEKEEKEQRKEIV